MRKLLASLWLVLVPLMLLIAPAQAAPHAPSQAVCEFLWDVALVADAMAKEGYDASQVARVVDRVYGTDGKAFLETLFAAIVAATQREKAQPAPDLGSGQPNFAARLRNTCLRNDGDMDSILGAGT